MKLSVILPLRNEEKNLLPLHSALQQTLTPLSSEYELIFVDDGSMDASLQTLTALHAQDSRVKILSFTRNFGHQVALTAGLDHATGDAVIMMDADGQHPVEMIPKLIHEWKNGAEVVYAVRTTGSSSLLQGGLDTLFYKTFPWITGIPLPPHSADFRLLDKKVVDVLRTQLRERVRFMRGLTAWLGYRSVQIPYRGQGRKQGTSQYHWTDRLHLAIDGLVSFSARPLYAAIYAGIFFTGIGAFYAPYAAYMRLVSHHVVPGWTSLMMVISLIGGIQLILLGIVGLYIGKIYEEVKHRPLYVLRQSTGLPTATPQ